MDDKCYVAAIADWVIMVTTIQSLPQLMMFKIVFKRYTYPYARKLVDSHKINQNEKNISIPNLGGWQEK